MPLTPLDRDRLREALGLAEAAIGLSEPNPRVGCVIGRDDGTVLGRGHTQQVGGPHAEVVALHEARSAGHDLRGATAWVTLEPCAHHGRTPPCADALVDAGLARVVVAIGDPFPQVAGAGLARLRDAGVDVVVADAADPLAVAAREVNIGFFARVERGRPWVRLKVAISLDGRSALPDGRSQWITGPAARADGHAWRRRAGAVLTGSGTVLADDPRLDVREVPTTVQPLRVVLDARGRVATAARILAAPGRVLLVGAGADGASPTAAPATPTDPATVERLTVPRVDGRIDLVALLQALAARAVNELHVEAGPTLNGSLLDAGLVDELLVYQAPMLIGPGRPLAERAPLPSLDRAERWRCIDATRLADDERGDWRLRLRPA